MKCPNCNNDLLKIDAIVGGYICNQCGKVYTEKGCELIEV